ncbi:hypothetical protein OUZ56_021546 [Daphnia magna]|uniref:Uncharacterized protein n=1 Tax=Daphnia magna TaxID=35525 RepID=A0ABQ9ZHN6_9CRUS|nr:hypothetical protein OUZ56_021546 [Daphnia magna]
MQTCDENEKLPAHTTRTAASPTQSCSLPPNTNNTWIVIFKKQVDGTTVKVCTHITQSSPSDVRQMSGSYVEYIFLISSGQPDIRFGCPMDVIFFGFDRPQQHRRTF